MGRGEREGEPVTMTEGKQERIEQNSVQAQVIARAEGKPFSASLRLHFLSKTLSLLFVCLFTKSERAQRQVPPMHPEFQPPCVGALAAFWTRVVSKEQD